MEPQLRYGAHTDFDGFTILQRALVAIARAWHAGVRFQQQVYLVGGKAGDKYFNDMWVRDPRLANLFPITQFTERGASGAKAVPSDQSSDQDFYFQSDSKSFNWKKRR